MTEPKKYTCSFCGKDNHQVVAMIAGPQVNICSECVGLCNNMIGDHIHNLPMRKQENMEMVGGA